MTGGGGVGGPSGVADLRGGPGTFRGVGYQTQVAVVRLLGELHGAWRDPLRDRHVRFELRELLSDDNGKVAGQFGYDIGAQTEEVLTSAEEVKSTPSVSDVDEFLGHLRSLPPAFTSAEIRLVVAAVTAPVRRLEWLLRWAREAVTEGELVAAVARLGGEQEQALFALAGGGAAHGVLRRAWVSLEATPVLSTQQETLVSAMARAGKREALAGAVLQVVTTASESRESVSVGGLLERLQGEGLLAPPPAMDMHDGDLALLQAMVSLEACPVPVPPSVLARAVRSDEATLTGTLAGAVRAGKVVVTGDGSLWRPPVPNKLDREGHDDVLHRLLREFVAWPSGASDILAAAQTPNVLALCRILDAGWPGTVAGAFTAYDKPAKTYGDLGVLHDLATVSRDAARTAASVACDDQRDTLLDHVSRAEICGVSWVLQRVGEHESASETLARAREVAERTGDDKSVAFADKCHGRIERLRAEALLREHSRLDDAAVRRALDNSAALLGRSRAAFAELVGRGMAVPKDAAECTCLLARTRAVEGLDGEARSLADEARPALVASGRGKEWADLRLLDAELDLRAVRAALGGQDRAGGAEATARALASARAAVDEVVSGFDGVVTPPWGRANSEIAARAALLSGRVFAAAGDQPAARTAFDAARAMYDGLGYDQAAAEAAYESLATAPGRIPEGLTAAAEASGVDRVVVVKTLRRHEARGWSGPGDLSYWRGMVDRTSTEVLAGRTTWAERRRSA